MMRRIVLTFLGAVIAIASISCWAHWLSNRNAIVVYFGRPHDILVYCSAHWSDLLSGAGNSLLTALVALSLTVLGSVCLLAIGLWREGWLGGIERVAAVAQTVPILVIVTFALIGERTLFKYLEVQPPLLVYSLGPVTLALLFPPLVFGAEAVIRLPVEIKALMRLWQAPTRFRIMRVYLPAALPSVLTGLRASATWAVSATLIAEGLLNGIEGDSKSLGYYLVRPFSSVAPGRTPSAILVAIVLGFAVYYLASWVQRIVEKRLLGVVAETASEYPLQAVR